MANVAATQSVDIDQPLALRATTTDRVDHTGNRLNNTLAKIYLLSAQPLS